MFIPMLAALRWTRLSSGQAALPRRSRSLRDSVPCLGGRQSRISRQNDQRDPEHLLRHLGCFIATLTANPAPII